MARQVNFSPSFVAPHGEANVQTVADHVEHIAKIAGKKQWVLILSERLSTPKLAFVALVLVATLTE